MDNPSGRDWWNSVKERGHDGAGRDDQIVKQKEGISPRSVCAKLRRHKKQTERFFLRSSNVRPRKRIISEDIEVTVPYHW